MPMHLITTAGKRMGFCGVFFLAQIFLCHFVTRNGFGHLDQELFRFRSIEMLIRVL